MIRRVFLFLVLSLPIAEAVRADRGEQRLSLNGLWSFTTDPMRLADGDAAWDRLPVPGNWDTRNTYAQHVGKGWYRRSFEVPLDWRGRRLRLAFDAVYETAEVSLKGVLLGRHEGGYTPFEFDVTEAVRWGAPNTLLVCADNSYRRGAWWAWGGISRSVALVANDPVRLVRQQVRGIPGGADGGAEVLADFFVRNDGAAAVLVALEGIVTAPGGGDVGRLRAQVEVPARSERRVSGRLALAPSAVRLWHFDHPYLYRLTTAASVGGAVRHERSDRFGIRSIVIAPDGLHLNGERVRLVGFNRVHDHRAYGNTEPEHLVRLDVDLMKSWGANFMRIMHAPSAPNLLDYLDEKGVLIIAEIPVWGAGDPNMEPGNPRTKRWLREMIERDYNHPCIIGWSAGNELLQHDAYVRSMLAYTRSELDPHRLHAYVSFSGGRKEYGPDNDPISASDLVLYNTYGEKMGELADRLRAHWPKLPVFFTEYGSKQFGETLDSRIPGLEARWRSLLGRDFVIGLSLWTFNDYRSNYKGSSPGELRSWGVVDLWRQPKAAAEDIARLHSPVRSLSVEGDLARIEPRAPSEIPSYALSGYHLVWEWTDARGAVLGGGVRALPVLLPGDRPLEVPLHGRPSGMYGAPIVRLVTPLGYPIHEYKPRSVSTDGLKESAAAGVQASAKEPAIAASAPRIVHLHPLDGGFMLGYSTEPDDTAFTVEYGTAPGRYEFKETIAMKGALAVHGLRNGMTYHVRLRREPAGRSPGAWSREVSVTPDGGVIPHPPQLRSVVRGNGLLAARFDPVPKAVAYRVRWSASGKTASSGERLLQGSRPGIVVIGGIDDAADYCVSMTTLTAAGESSASASLEAPRRR